MFVRFRQTARRLQISLITGCREGTKVRHEHVAGLGSVPLEPTKADRIAFWTRLHQRLEALSNRIDTAQRGAILAAVHARIPIPTPDDQQAVHLERAQADARFWATLAEMHADDIEGRKGLLASTQRTITEREPLAADTAAKAQAAKDRLARVEKGEDVGGIPAPMARKDLLRLASMTEAQARHAQRLATITDTYGEQVVLDEMARAQKKAEKAVRRRLYRGLAHP